MGSFGGGYFRDIYSSVTQTQYKDIWKELPSEWVEGVDIETQVASRTYDKSCNKYGVDCGAKESKSDSHGQLFWESKGWIEPLDPYGWFMW